MLMVAEADFVVSAWLVAVTVTEVDCGTASTAKLTTGAGPGPGVTETVCGVVGGGSCAEGAVYKPDDETLPVPEGLSDHVTFVLVLPETVAVNCSVAPKPIDAVDGERVILTVEGGGCVPPPPPPPQLSASHATLRPAPSTSVLESFARRIDWASQNRFPAVLSRPGNLRLFIRQAWRAKGTCPIFSILI